MVWSIGNGLAVIGCAAAAVACVALGATDFAVAFTVATFLAVVM